MEAPLQQHYKQGKPAIDHQEVEKLYQQAKLDSIKFNAASTIDYISEAMSNFTNQPNIQRNTSLKSKFLKSNIP